MKDAEPATRGRVSTGTVRLFVGLVFFLSTIVCPSQIYVGAGFGSEFANRFYARPFYADRDISLSISASWKFLVFEGRHMLRYLGEPDFNTSRYNTFLLFGVTTRQISAFSFDLMGGVAYSTLTSKPSNGFVNYSGQSDFAFKMGFMARISAKRRLYLSLGGFVWAEIYHIGRATVLNTPTSVVISLSHRLNTKRGQGS
jgi:hypothetical protein